MNLLPIIALNGLFQSSRDVVKNATRGLKIGVHLRFCPKFTVEFEYFDQKKFRQAYYVIQQIFP